MKLQREICPSFSISPSNLPILLNAHPLMGAMLCQALARISPKNILNLNFTLHCTESIQSICVDANVANDQFIFCDEQEMIQNHLIRKLIYKANLPLQVKSGFPICIFSMRRVMFLPDYYHLWKIYTDLRMWRLEIWGHVCPRRGRFN